MQEEKTTAASAGTETAAAMQAHPHHHTLVLFHHEPHQHQPRNVNEVQKAELQGFNTRLAVWLTRIVGTMACAYLFAVIGIAGLIGAFTDNASLVLIFGSISSYFLQLVLLPVILVGGNVLNRHQELQSDETFQTSQHSFHDIEQIMQHLSAQDGELLRQARMLEQLLVKNGVTLQQLEADLGHANHLEAYTQQLSPDAPTTSTPTEGVK
jgi:hypothetical protein